MDGRRRVADGMNLYYARMVVSGIDPSGTRLLDELGKTAVRCITVTRGSRTPSGTTIKCCLFLEVFKQLEHDMREIDHVLKCEGKSWEDVFRMRTKIVERWECTISPNPFPDPDPPTPWDPPPKGPPDGDEGLGYPACCVYMSGTGFRIPNKPLWEIQPEDVIIFYGGQDYYLAADVICPSNESLMTCCANFHMSLPPLPRGLTWYGHVGRTHVGHCTGGEALDRYHPHPQL